MADSRGIAVIGPSDASIAKLNDVYRKVVYIKTREYKVLVDLKNKLEAYIRDNNDFKYVNVQFDFNPMSGF